MKMKRLISMMLATCLLLCTALAENKTLFTTMTDEEVSANSELTAEEQQIEYRPQKVVAVGDGFRIVMRNEALNTLDLYSWREGEEGLTLVAKYLCTTNYASSLDELQASLENVTEESESLPADFELPDTSHCYSILVGSGDKLYGINALTGTIFTIDGQDGKAVYTDVATMADTSFFFQTEEGYYDEEEGEETEAYVYYTVPNTYAASGDTLALQFQNYTDNGCERVVKLVSLTDGSVKTAGVLKNPRSVCAYKDGKFVVLDCDSQENYDEEGNPVNMRVVIYDPAADTAEVLADSIDSSILEESDLNMGNDFYYSETLDGFLYFTGTKVMMTKDFKTAVTAAYLPIQSSCRAVNNSCVVVANYSNGVFARTLSENASGGHVIVLLNVSVYGGISNYAVNNPDVAVYGYYGGAGTAEEVAQEFAATTDTPDVAVAYLSTNTEDPAGGWFLDALNNKGYCMDLSVYPAVKQYVESLNDVFRSLVTTEDGKIFGVPTSVYGGYSFSFNSDVLTEMGLTVDDLPTNLVELCEFITRWNDEFVEEYPNYAPLDSTESYRDRVFRLILREWNSYCQATGQDLHFDDPIFRELMTAFENMRYDNIEKSNQKTSDEESDYKAPLIYSGTSVFSAYYDRISYGDDDTPLMIKMTLTKDTEFYLGTGDVEVYYVNPRTTDKEEVGELLEYIINAIDKTTLIELVKDDTTPIENEYFQSNMEIYNEDIETLQEQYEAASEEEKADYKQMLEETIQYRDEYEKDGRYLVSPEYIERYQNVILPALFVWKPTALDCTDDSSGLQTLVTRYIDKQITIDQFIKEMDNRLNMIRLENQ